MLGETKLTLRGATWGAGENMGVFNIDFHDEGVNIFYSTDPLTTWYADSETTLKMSNNISDLTNPKLI